VVFSIEQSCAFTGYAITICLSVSQLTSLPHSKVVHCIRMAKYSPIARTVWQ